MHKIIITLLAITTFFVSTITLANSLEIAKSNTTNPAINPHYSSSLSPKKTGLRAAFSYYASDITVINATSNVIYTVIPDVINDFTSRDETDHLFHPTYAGDTFLILEDPNHAAFFQSDVCHLALVIIYGSPGSYTVKVDRSYCARP